jgi:hypothetical protein
MGADIDGIQGTRDPLTRMIIVISALNPKVIFSLSKWLDVGFVKKALTSKVNKKYWGWTSME